MTKFQEAIELYKSFMSKKLNITDVNETVLIKLAQMLGESIYDADASLVACSDKGELSRVRELYLLGELKLTESPARDEAIKTVCKTMGTSNRKKYRVVFYYLLLQQFGLESQFSGINAVKDTVKTAKPKAKATEKVANSEIKVEEKTKKEAIELVKSVSKTAKEKASDKIEKSTKEKPIFESLNLDEKVNYLITLIREDLNFDDIHYDLLSNLVATSGDTSIINILSDDENWYIKENFLKGRLGLNDYDNLDEAIFVVNTRMGNVPKHRPVFYYLLTKHLGREWVILEPTMANLF